MFARKFLRKPSSFQFLAIGSVLLGLLGCERITRVKQCVALVDAVNTAMDAIKSESEGKLDPGSLELAASHYAELAEVLGPMQFNDQQMALDVEAFRRLLVR